MTRPTREPDYVVIDRNGVIENRHQLHVAVVDGRGTLLFYTGDPSRVTLVRSAAKPAQSVAVAETGALEKYGYDEADLAIMCASHSSEPGHAARVTDMLAKSGSVEAELQCGAHPAHLPDRHHAWLRAGFEPTPIWSNCSGKHAGMLAACRALGVDTANYHHLDHPLQLRIQRVTEEMGGLTPKDVQWAVDGCNLPAPAYPLAALAQTNVALAKAADAAERGDEAMTPREKTMARVFNAMTTYPEMVAGEGRFCTRFMRAYKGQAIGKLGADACYGIGIRESEETRRLGAVGPIGIAAKIEDGNIDVMYGALVEILERFQLGTPEMRGELDMYLKQSVKNTRGIVTGQISYPFVLRKPEGVV